MVKAVETGKNARLDEPTVKKHTGGDTVTTRALYGQQTEWKPNHKLILVSNEKPHIHGTDEGIWSRVRMVPFTVTIPEEKRIPDLFQNKLEPEASGILNWAIRWVSQELASSRAVPSCGSQFSLFNRSGQRQRAARSRMERRIVRPYQYPAHPRYPTTPMRTRLRGERPPGWGHGKKTGWGNCGLPPGQAKKYGCRTYVYEDRPHYYSQDKGADRRASPHHRGSR